MDVARDIAQGFAKGEKVEGELDILITRRHEKRRETEGERRERELWQDTEIRHAQQRREANRLAWCEYHRSAAERHRATLASLISHHETQAEKYRENGHYHENHEKE
jgi:hypothetical protein